MRRRSPFPGMDPYLELVWSDVHSRLTYLASETIQGQLGDDLVARSEGHVYVSVPSDDDIAFVRSMRPDVHVAEFSPDGGTGGVAVAEPAVSVAEPIVFELELEPVEQHYLEILDRSTDGRVITVIEFTSPANKRRGPGLVAYRQKQDECRQGGVNLVEIDLTRSGTRELLVNEWPQARQHPSMYAASVWRAAEPNRCALYRIRLPDRLPTIKIPLRAGEADVTLDLQEIVDQAYASGRQDKLINYAKPVEPPLSDVDAAWAATLTAASVA